ncbi:hypothetical protein RB595_003848 [Gaeumannomyces hyphopodioides]
MPKMQRALIRAGILAAVSSPATLAAATPCDKADTDRFQKTCTDFAKIVNVANSTVTSTDFVPAGTTLVTVSLCRVQANISTSADSGLHFEAWLPQNWTGRFLSTGNGGLGGCIQYEDVEWAASLGFAAVGTNNGHDGTSGAAFLDKPDVVEDFAYRAMATGVRAGKASGHFLYLTGANTSDNFVGRELWSVVHQDILDKCDALDGSADGVLEAPDLCRYTADDLLCGGARNATAPGCLTSKQVGTVNAVFSEMRSADGAALCPRMQPGSEAAAFDTSDDLNPFDIRSFRGDIGAFRDRGGKLLHYHGLMDNVISSDISPRYYEEVSRALGGASPAELDGFYRLFRISGMGHCRNGPGAHFIGNNRAQLSADPAAVDDSVLMSLVRWVEEGEAPDVIRGAGTADGKAGPTTFSKNHCCWPLMNKFQGDDASSPDSWKCVSYNATT